MTIHHLKLGAGPMTASHLTRLDQGSMSIEAVLIIPVFLVFLALIAAIGRTAAVQEDLHASIVAGVRIASLESSSFDGENAARTAIENHLADEGVTCTSSDISINTDALDLPPGQPGEVWATIACTVPLSDLSVPGLPGHIRLTDTFSTPIDPYSQ